MGLPGKRDGDDTVLVGVFGSVERQYFDPSDQQSAAVYGFDPFFTAYGVGSRGYQGGKGECVCDEERSVDLRVGGECGYGCGGGQDRVEINTQREVQADDLSYLAGEVYWGGGYPKLGRVAGVWHPEVDWWGTRELYRAGCGVFAGAGGEVNRDQDLFSSAFIFLVRSFCPAMIFRTSAESSDNLSEISFRGSSSLTE
jgi:hypothetical protein